MRTYHAICIAIMVLGWTYIAFATGQISATLECASMNLKDMQHTLEGIGKLRDDLRKMN